MHHPIFDFLFYWISNKWIWIPLYLGLMIFIIKEYGYGKELLFILIFTAVLVTFTDQISVYVKNLVQRLRPCHENEIRSWFPLIQNVCGGSFGFFSSHAANSFGIAIFVGNIIKNKPFLKRFLLIWAVVVSISRVYLGVHYFTDILVGAIFGGLSGWIMFQVCQKILKKK
jgi:undecaprenyl-diphosphatase